jgi:3-hydroxyacyl-CoA dehydrogenase
MEETEMGVTVQKRGKAAIVIIDNPPANAIGVGERKGLLDAARSLTEETEIDRVILCGRGTAFAAGADAREFDSDPQEPHLPDVIAEIEQSPVPWIAAINGVALGGGAEIALGCRYRIAAPNAQIGLPEVTLGVVPGAGATQRLPRLIGIAKALEIISLGKSLNALDAASIGFVDAVGGDPLQAAEKLNIDVVKARPAISEMPAPLADGEAVRIARTRAHKHMRLQDAPQMAIDLVEASATLPFAEAMTRERQAFLSLRKSSQAKALRHVFFSERRAKAPDWLQDAIPVDVQKAVVVGGGTMGAAIAYALDSAGIRVTIIEDGSEAAERAVANVGKLTDAALKRGLIGEGKAAEISKRIAVIEGFDPLPDADLAIEAVFEDMEIKKHVFAKLEKALSDHAVLATNTSYLDINEMASVLVDPARLVGLHFFAPAHVMKLLEIVRGGKTSNVALATAFAVSKKLRKIPVLAGVCDGFIGNRILARYREAADTLLMDGAPPWDIDEAVVEFGYAMGPYEAQDLSGLDIAYANRKRQAATRDPNRRYIPISDRMVAEGRLGRKTCVGWYRYPGGGGKVLDPLVEDLIREEAHFAKVQRREFSRDEVRERVLTAMINEAADILEEGIARSPADIDLVLIHGYGFPRWRGGLMHYADQLGPKSVLSHLRLFCEEDPVVWKPSPLIERLADEDKTFADSGAAFGGLGQPVTRKGPD